MGEKVTNGTFETWPSATNAGSWTETLVGTTTINRDTDAYAGTYCVRFDVSSVPDVSKHGQTITLTTETPYLLSYWYKHGAGAPTDNGGQIWFFGSDNDDYGVEINGNFRNADNYDGIPLDNTVTTWTQVRIPFVSNAVDTSYTLWVRPSSYGAGGYSFYVDNISIDDTLIDHESDGITLADVGGSGRQVVYDSVSIKDDFKYYLASSEGKIFTYSGDYLSDDGSVILSRWRSKTLDFSDQLPQCLDKMKEVTGVKLIYKDITTSTNVTVYVSSDGGSTWEHETKSLGTGTGEILSATYHFIKTGEYFIFAIEHASTDKEFMWLRMEADVVPLGPYIEI